MVQTGKLCIRALCFALASIIPAACAQANAQKPFEFEVFSIHPHKPNTMPFPMEFTPNGYTDSERLSEIIMRAYNPQFWLYWRLSKIQNAPAWVGNDLYDINARVPQENVADWQKVMWQNSDLLRSALQAALKASFKLELHITAIQVPYLDLTVDRRGARLQPSAFTARPVGYKTVKLGNGYYFENNGERRFVGVSMEELAHLLTQLNPDYPVQDKTGLAGRFDFTLPWFGPQQYPESEFASPLGRMPLKDIGLTLKKGTGPAYVIKIDHIERPDSN